jgi:hypothetical protein
MTELVQLSEIIRNLGLVVAAGIGIYLAWRRVSAATRQADASLQQAEMARRGHVAELFNRAVGQLTDQKLEIRLGAIYTLRQIALDFPDLSKPTFELLSMYLTESAADYRDRAPPVDVREIMDTIRQAWGRNE